MSIIINYNIYSYSYSIFCFNILKKVKNLNNIYTNNINQNIVYFIAISI